MVFLEAGINSSHDSDSRLLEVFLMHGCFFCHTDHSKVYEGR